MKHLPANLASWAFVLFLIPAPPAGCQTRLREAEPLAGIRVTKVVTLGSEEGPGYLGESGDVDRLSNGDWVANDTYNPTEIKFFSPSGDWKNTIGREGEGPGEFAWVWQFQPLPGNRLAVFDSRAGRITEYSSDLTVAKTLKIPFRMDSGVYFENQGVVAGSRLSGPEQIGLPLHLVDTTGVLTRSFGADPPILDWANRDKVSRTLARSGSDAVWSGEWTRYSVERWTISGERTHHLVRHVPWFEPHEDSGVPRDRSEAPGPRILGIYQDDDGLLWVASQIADLRFEESLEPGADAYGRPTQSISDWNTYFDTMLEVIDPERGLVLASERLPMAFWGLTSGGFLYSSLYEEGLVPVVEVWEAAVEGK